MVNRRSDPLRPYTVRLLVGNFRKSWRFYRDVLRLKPVKGHGEPPYGEFESKGRVVLAIFDRKLMARAVGLEPGRYPTECVGKSALIFQVRDVDAAAKRLKARGVRLLAGPVDRPDWMLRTIHLRDPDGYLVEIFSRPRHR